MKLVIAGLLLLAFAGFLDMVIGIIEMITGMKKNDR